MPTKISWFLNLSKKELINLQKLDLSDERGLGLLDFKISEIDILCTRLSRCCNLQQLNLSYINLWFLRYDVFKNLCGALAELKELQQLDLSRNQIGYFDREYVLCLSASIPKLSELTKLNLGGNDLAMLDRGSFIILLNAIRHCIKLKSFLLYDNKFYLLQKEKIVILRELFDGLNNLITLNLRKNDLGVLTDELFSEFCLLLLQCRHLWQLDLSFNKLYLLKDLMFSDLCNILLSFNNLQVLQLMYNQLDSLNSSCVLSLCVVLQKMQIINLNRNDLGCLDYDQFCNFCNVIKNNKQLRQLNLAGNDISLYDKIFILRNALIDCGSCTTLDLSRNGFLLLYGYYALCSIIAKVSSLQTLYLNHNNLVEVDVDKLQIFPKAVKESNQLQKLYLQGNNFNKLSDYDLLKFCEGLASCNLKLLDLRNNNFTADKTALVNKCFELIHIKSLQKVQCSDQKTRSILLSWQRYRSLDNHKKVAKTTVSNFIDIFNLIKRFSRLNIQKVQDIQEVQENSDFGNNFSNLTTELVELVLEYCDLIKTEPNGTKSQPKVFKLDVKL